MMLMMNTNFSEYIYIYIYIYIYQCKGPNFCEAMSVNWNKCKMQIDWFTLKHRTNDFKKHQGNNKRVC